MAKSASAAAPALTPHPAPGHHAPRVSPIAPACARPPTRSNSRTPSSCSTSGSDVPPTRRARAQRTPAGSAPQARRQCRSGDRGAAYRALRRLQPMSHQNALRSKMTLPCVTFPSRPMRFHLRAHLCAPARPPSRVLPPPPRRKHGRRHSALGRRLEGGGEGKGLRWRQRRWAVRRRCEAASRRWRARVCLAGAGPGGGAAAAAAMGSALRI